jgi:hypothetical protein
MYSIGLQGTPHGTRECVFFSMFFAFVCADAGLWQRSRMLRSDQTTNLPRRRVVLSCLSMNARISAPDIPFVLYWDAFSANRGYCRRWVASRRPSPLVIRFVIW